MARDVQPMMRFGVSLGGRRWTASCSPAHGREAARIAIAMLDAVDAPAGELPVVLGPG
jgi:predicted Zn-dependent protease